MQGDVATKSLAQHPFTHIHGPVLTATRPCMVCVGMSDQCPWHRSAWIDPGISGLAIQTAVGVLENRHRFTLATELLPLWWCESVLIPLIELIDAS